MVSEKLFLSQVQESQKGRFHFTIEKDILLLKEVLICNFFQLGADMWTTIIKSLKDDYNWDISVRTAKDRVSNLLAKMEKEDLSTKTGTDEQISEMKNLWCEIQSIKEETVTMFAGTSESAGRKEEIIQANKERDCIVQEKYGSDSPLSSTTTLRRKVVKTEEEILLKRQVLDHELEEKRLSFQHEEKMRQLEAENAKVLGDNDFRLKSLETEKRLEIERSNKELSSTVLDTMRAIYEKLGGK